MRLVLALFALAATPLPAAEQPNILFILADDQRPDSIGASGNKHVRTRTIDMLAKNGARFPNAYLTGGDTGALCSPSRAMLMTGRSFTRIGRAGGWDVKPVDMLPNRLRDAGYDTFMTGKWHNGLPALRHAFPDAANVMNGGMGDHLTKKVIQLSNGEASPPAPLPNYSTDAFTDAAVSFLESRKSAAPFFLYVAFTAPHDPRQPVSPWKEYHEANLPPLPANFLPLPAFNTGGLLVRDEHLAPWPRPEWIIREQTAHYHAMIDHIDRSVLRLITALHQNGKFRNTLIIYSADNGLALGSHGLLGKQNGYDHSLKVPMVIHGPGVKPGVIHEHPVALFDLMPTILEAAGAEVPDDLDARSLTPALAGNPGPIRERVSSSVFFGDLDIHQLREGDWKIIRYPRLDKTELFNIADDPDETHDLSGERQHAPRVRAMLAALEREMESSGVDRPLTSDARIPEAVDPAKLKQRMDQHQPAWIRKRFSKSTRPTGD